MAEAWAMECGLLFEFVDGNFVNNGKKSVWFGSTEVLVLLPVA